MATKNGFRLPIEKSWWLDGDWKWVLVTIWRILIVGWWPKFFSRQWLNLEMGAYNMFLESSCWDLHIATKNSIANNIEITMVGDQKCFGCPSIGDQFFKINQPKHFSIVIRMAIENGCWSPCDKSRLLDGHQFFLLIINWISKRTCHMFLQTFIELYT
jgi:hypothetical protein